MLSLWVMNSKITKFSAIKWQPVLAAVAIICVILSSCAIKSSIKGFLGLKQVKNHKTLNYNYINSFISSSTISCLYDTEVQKTSVEASVFKFNGHSDGILRLCALFCFVVALSFTQQQKGQAQFGQRVILPPLPIFLQYRKLII